MSTRQYLDCGLHQSVVICNVCGKEEPLTDWEPRGLTGDELDALPMPEGWQMHKRFALDHFPRHYCPEHNQKEEL